MERHQSRAVRALNRAPSEALVLTLVEDLRLPLLACAGSRDLAREPVLISCELLDPMNSLREQASAHPLVPDKVKRRCHIDRNLNRQPVVDALLNGTASEFASSLRK